MKKEKINKKYYKKYTDFIDKIIKKHGRFRKTKENKKFERHHIKPKCIGGTNSKRNLVDLTYIEHFKAHKLLHLSYPDNKGLNYALFKMLHREVVIKSLTQAQLDNLLESALKILSKHNHEQKVNYYKNPKNRKKQKEFLNKLNSDPKIKKKRVNSLRKTYKRKDVREAISKRLTGHIVTEKTREKLSKKQKIIQKQLTEKQKKEIREKISKKLKGNKHPFYGKHHTKEARQKIRKGQEEYYKNPKNRKKRQEINKKSHNTKKYKMYCTKRNKGRRWWTNGKITTFCKNKPGKGWKRGREIK